MGNYRTIFVKQFLCNSSKESERLIKEPEGTQFGKEKNLIQRKNITQIIDMTRNDHKIAMQIKSPKKLFTTHKWHDLNNLNN